MARDEDDEHISDEPPRRPRKPDEAEVEGGNAVEPRSEEEDDENPYCQSDRSVFRKDNWLDQIFLNRDFAVLYFFAVFCGGFVGMPAAILGVVVTIFALCYFGLMSIFGLAGTIGCTNPKARQRAILLLISAVVMQFGYGWLFLWGYR